MYLKHRQILCVPNQQSFVTGVLPCPKNLFLVSEWRYRTEGLEYDENWRQIIPYVIVWHDGKALSYSRSGSEDRLHDLVSFGFGGHVDREDEYRGSRWLTVADAAKRELWEELHLHRGLLTVPTSMVCDNSDGVGRVHLGLIYQVFIDDEDLQQVQVDPDEIGDLKARSLDELRECRLEGWSGLVLDWLVGQRTGGKPGGKVVA